MPDGDVVPALRIPQIFFGLTQQAEWVTTLNRLIGQIGDVGDPRSQWFMADNLITYGHTAGFRRDLAFVSAVAAANPKPMELAIAWRTHTLCWAARSCLAVAGDYVECGTYEGYSMEVVLRYLDGLAGRQCWLYDLFNPTGAQGEGKPLPEHSPVLFEKVKARFAAWPNVTVTQGKVPDILRTVSPERLAFLHVDMNNTDAERGAMEVLFDRLSTGGMVVFDDYGWTGYQDQKQAADQFAAGHGLSILELPTGQGLLIKR
jgi:predicted O-methyltransferase YrrM